MVYRCRAQQRTPRFDLIRPGGVLAIDCEGIQLPDETSWRKNGCGRVSIVNENEEVIYDTFVHHGRNVEVKAGPRRFGVTWKDIQPRFGATHINEVTQAVRKIFDRNAGIVVGHAIKSEMRYLHYLDWDKYDTRDTQGLFYEETDSLKLQVLAADILGRSIQTVEHSSVDDARATMALYLLHQKTMKPVYLWDRAISSGSDSGETLDDSTGSSSEKVSTLATEVSDVVDVLTTLRISAPR